MAASEQAEQAGNERYHQNHMGAIFEEGFSFSGYERDLLKLGLGDGRFLDISGVSGVDSISDGRGAVFADFDNDGDLDVFLTTAQREAHYLFRNNVGNRNGFLRVELVGRSAGRDAFGTVVRVTSSAGVQTKLKAGGSGFVSQHDPRLLFGLGGDAGAESVEVTWPGGERQRFDGVPAGTVLRVTQGGAEPERIAERRFSLVDPLAREQTFLARLGIRRGAPFPDIPLRDLSGAPARLGDLLRPGRLGLINLWATWCVPCSREMPELERLRGGLARNGIDLIGISIDLETARHVPDYLEQRGIGYPVYLTDETALEALYPTGEATVPLTVLLGDQGTVVEIFSGWSPKSEQALRELVRSPIGGGK